MNLVRLNDAIDMFKKSDRFNRLAPTTKRYYSRSLKIISDNVPDYEGNLDKALSRAWAMDVLQDNGAPGIMNQTLSVGRVLFNWMINEGMYAHNPFSNINPRSLGQREPWEDQYIQTMKDKLQGRARRLFYMLLFTGQRFADVCSVTYGDFHIGDDGMFVHVRQSKTNRVLLIPLADELKRELFQSLEDIDLITSKPDLYVVSGTYSPSHTWNGEVFRMNCRKLHIPPSLKIHGLRYTCASKLAEAGCTDSEIMAITGHSTNAMIRKYTAKANQKTMAINALRKIGAI